jgi:hypothetical protein
MTGKKTPNANQPTKDPERIFPKYEKLIFCFPFQHPLYTLTTSLLASFILPFFIRFMDTNTSKQNIVCSCLFLIL